SGSTDIFIANIDGSNEVNLTNNPGVDDSYPQWSPDGSKIAYRVGPFASADLYAMDADGSNIQQLTNATGYERNPIWSPDGSKIAYESNDLARAYRINADGTNPQPIISGGSPCNCYDLEWSLDG